MNTPNILKEIYDALRQWKEYVWDVLCPTNTSSTEEAELLDSGVALACPHLKL